MNPLWEVLLESIKDRYGIELFNTVSKLLEANKEDEAIEIVNNFEP